MTFSSNMIIVFQEKGFHVDTEFYRLPVTDVFSYSIHTQNKIWINQFPCTLKIRWITSGISENIGNFYTSF